MRLLLGRVFSPEFFLVSLVQFLDHVQRFTDKLFADNFDKFVLLKGFTRNIQRQIIRIDDTTNEVQIIGHDVLEVIGYENTANVELNGYKMIDRIIYRKK